MSKEGLIEYQNKLIYAIRKDKKYGIPVNKKIFTSVISASIEFYNEQDKSEYYGGYHWNLPNNGWNIINDENSKDETINKIKDFLIDKYNLDINHCLKLANDIETKFYEPINESNYVEEPVTDEERKEFIKTVNKHRALVNHYAEKIGKFYPNHDMDKYSPEIMDPYVKGFIRGKNLTPEEQKAFRNAQHLHYLHNEHHPEHWDDSPVPNVRMKIPKETIEEMCADWCAMSKRFGNSPFDRAKKSYR